MAILLFKAKARVKEEKVCSRGNDAFHSTKMKPNLTESVKIIKQEAGLLSPVK